MLILLEILLYQGLLMLAYQWIKREPFFQMNRMYLLMSLLVSFIWPFLDWNWFQLSVHPATFQKLNTIYLPEVVVGSSESSTSIQSTSSFNYLTALENLYYVGFSIAVGFLYNKIQIIRTLINGNTWVADGHFKLIYVKNSKEAFSFYNYIFIGKDLCTKEQATILAHEQQHVHLKHSWDNTFLTLLRVFMWFNPLLYYYHKELQLLHEYQADAKVCEKYNPQKYIWQLLNSAFNTKNMSLMSSFYTTSFIKNRIVMLQKSKKNRRSILKYAVITPLLLVAFSFQVVAQSSLPLDEKALFEKYKKEVYEMSVNNRSAFIDFLEKIDKDNNGMLTKEGYSKMKAVAYIAFKNNDYNSPHDSSILSKPYATYVNEMKAKGRKNDSLKTTTTDIAYQNNLAVDKTDVPFASVERAPVFPGCDENLSNEDLKKCMSQKIQAHILAHFDISTAKKHGLKGENRIYVRFKIGKDGNIYDVQARASHAELKNISEHVIQSLPSMKPGLHKEEAVNVIYTLPITFLLPEGETKEEK